MTTQDNARQRKTRQDNFVRKGPVANRRPRAPIAPIGGPGRPGFPRARARTAHIGPETWHPSRARAPFGLVPRRSPAKVRRPGESNRRPVEPTRAKTDRRRERAHEGGPRRQPVPIPWTVGDLRPELARGQVSNRQAVHFQAKGIEGARKARFRPRGQDQRPLLLLLFLGEFPQSVLRGRRSVQLRRWRS